MLSPDASKIAAHTECTKNAALRNNTGQLRLPRVFMNPYRIRTIIMTSAHLAVSALPCPGFAVKRETARPARGASMPQGGEIVKR